MSDAGRSFAVHLAALVRVNAVGEIASRPASRLLAWFLTDLSALAAHPSSPQFEVEDGLVVGGERVRLNRVLDPVISAFSAELGGHGAAGVALRAGPDREAVLTLFRSLRSVPSDFSRDAHQKWLDANGGGCFRLVPVRAETLGEEPPRAQPESLKTYGRLWYAVAKARAARTIARVPPEVRRAMRLLVERAESEPRHHLALASIIDDEDGATRHCVHAAIFAIALGQRLGLGRGDLVDLGLAALLAAEVPDGAAEDAIIAATGAQLGTPRLGPGEARRMLSVFECRMGVDRQGIPKARVQKLHVFGRIVAIANDFDVLVARSTTRSGLLPDEALQRMQAQAGRRYDKSLLRVFADTIGPFPLGSAVLLDSGEVGVVYRVPPGAGTRPVVRLVVDKRGAVLRAGPLVDLGERGPSVRRIVATIDATALGINPADALFG